MECSLEVTFHEDDLSNTRRRCFCNKHGLHGFFWHPEGYRKPYCTYRKRMAAAVLSVYILRNLPVLGLCTVYFLLL